MKNLSGIALLMGGLVAFSLVRRFLTQQKASQGAEVLESFARKHGLTLTSPTEASGLYQQRPLQLRREQRKVPGKRAWYPVTVVRFDVSDALPPEFSLTRSGFGGVLGGALEGEQDAKVGAEGFDNAFSLANVSPETREVLKTTPVLESCWRLNELHEFHIQQGWLHTAHTELPETAEVMEDLVDSVLEAPRALATAAASVRARRSA